VIAVGTMNSAVLEKIGSKAWLLFGIDFPLFFPSPSYFLLFYYIFVSKLWACEMKG